jgi:hypothetical protein
MGNTNLDLMPHYPKDPAPSSKQARFRKEHSCTPETPCGLLPCNACGEAAQAWFIKQHRTMFKVTSPLVMVSIVPSSLIYDYNDIDSINVKKSARYFRDLLKKSGLSDLVVFGAIDISLNVDRINDQPTSWSVHCMLICEELGMQKKEALKHNLPKGGGVLRPLRIESVYDLKGAAKYCSKSSFCKRTAYLNADNKKQTFKNPINGEAETKLMRALAQTLHQHRLITIGLRRHGSQLIKLL